MAYKATGKSSAPKRGPLKHIMIEKAHNGFSISKHHGPAAGASEYGPSAPEDAPTVFTKHGPAVKHIKGLMSQMHPPAAGDDEQMEAGAPPEGQQA